MPAGFRFSVKLPKAITHDAQLATWEPVLDRFLEEVGALGEKLGCVLVQLPPKLAFEHTVAEAFFRSLCTSYSGPIAVEPRHPTWAEETVESFLRDHGIARVAADPVRFPGADRPAGSDRLVYYRLHGSPRIYHSAYPNAYLEQVAGELRRAAERGTEAWCIFDNTASGAAVPDALSLLARLRE